MKEPMPQEEALRKIAAAATDDEKRQVEAAAMTQTDNSARDGDNKRQLKTEPLGTVSKVIKWLRH